jgi:hypothetical protein
VQAPGQWFAFDEEFHLEARQQDFVEHPDGQLRLADGKTPHERLAVSTGSTVYINALQSLYAPLPTDVDRLPGRRSSL